MSKPKHVDLFCGSGGIGLGFKQAQFNTVFAIDKDKDSVESYNKNLGNAVIGDIETYDFPIIDNVFVVTGGFPCQPFSSAGKELGFSDPRTDFYKGLFNVFKQYNPKFIVLENVKRFTTHDKGNSLKRVTSDLEEIGYDVKWKVLNAYHYGVPQKRERVFIVANNIGVDYEYPQEQNDRYTVGDFIIDCDDYGYRYTPYKLGIFEHIPEGGNWHDLPMWKAKEVLSAGYFKEDGSFVNGNSTHFGRLSMSEPSPTLTTNPTRRMCSACHPTEDRPISIQESARIQSFPYEYEFVGSRASQYRQIGNAVPVNLAFNIGKSLARYYRG